MKSCQVAFFLFAVLTARQPLLAAAIDEAKASLAASDYKRAAKALKPLVEQGDPSAQWILGAMCHDGAGVSKDLARSLQWIRKAAEQGDGTGQFLLGRLYADGDGVAQDHREALKWYRKAADQGNRHALRSILPAYFKLPEVAKDPAEAEKWFRQAAEEGDPYAQVILGAMSYGDADARSKHLEAVEWFQKSAKQGNVLAEAYLGEVYAGDSLARDFDEAARWYREAAQRGFAKAQTILGKMYERGKGAPMDFTLAAEWLRKAAEQGDPDAQFELGVIYEPEDPASRQSIKEEERRWGEQAQKGSLSAQKKLDEYRQKIEVSDRKKLIENLPEAVRWLRLAADQGNHSAEYRLGRFYRDGIGVAQDKTEAAKWFRKAAEGGVPQAKTPKGTPIAKHHASDVDTPPFSLESDPNKFALVVGIEQYQKLPNADFAEHDAAAMRDYLLRMGYPEKNILCLNGENATRSRLLAGLEKWLPKNVKNDSMVFVYFSGHGAPSAETKRAYLMPWDGDPESPQSTVLPLKRVYADLNRLKTKKKVVVLDANFSVAGGRSVSVKSANPPVTKDDLGDVVLLTASSEDEAAGTLEEQEHGIFTYYFLKGLSRGAKSPAGALSAKWLYHDLRPLVEDTAHRHNLEQTPSLEGRDQDIEVIRFTEDQCARMTAPGCTLSAISAWPDGQARHLKPQTDLK